MIIQFKNREKELSELSDVLNSRRFEFIILYGRRRIGKTELILKATENIGRIYYLAVGARNLDRFHSLCARHYPEVSKLKTDWEVLFEFLENKTEVVVIDEFQNMIHEDANILNIFQSIIDITLKDSELKLFLLGSSVSIMTSRVLDYASPLYGRRTGSIELKAVSFFDLERFFPVAGTRELVEIYGFADGIPFYLIEIDKPFWQWLEGELTKKRSILGDEVDFLMRYEFKDVSTYKLILEAIAHGKTKLNEIKNFIKVKRTDISPYLRNLIEVGMIKRAVPVTENPKSRLGRYYLNDNFLKFWFRYIYPNLSSIEEGIFDINVVKEDYSTYLGGVFEEVVRQFLIKERDRIFGFSKIGKWWHKDQEIDVVALRDATKEILFVECKWQNLTCWQAEKILEDLSEKAKSVQWNSDSRKEYFGIVARKIEGKDNLVDKGFVACDIDDF
ncbi:ATP-binding protein [Methanosarcinales archaeon]|nr:MAG: ATP-binding protein [Methanosarcinales archaeon]